MRPVLGFQLEIAPDTSGGSDTVEWLKTRLERWIRGWYERRAVPIPAEVPLDASLPPNHRIHVNEERPSDVATLIELSWQYPADGDRTALWTTQATVASDESGVDLSLSLSIASAEFIARPFRYDLFVPHVIREIARSGRASLGDRTLSDSPRTVAVGKVDSFVERDLGDPKRRLPIVVLTRSNSSDVYPCDPAKLANELCGLAEVWLLPDRWRTYALTNAVGNKLSCFDGGLRTYWPGFGLSDDPFAHPLMTSTRLQGLQSQGIDIGRYLVRALAPVGAMRLSQSARANRIRSASIERRRTQAMLAVQAELAQGQVKELENQLLEAWKQNDSLETALKAERERADNAEKELDVVRQNFALVASSLGPEREDLAAEPVAGASIESVSEALEQARQEYPLLRIWASAMRSAGESHFARPQQVRQALDAIADIGRIVFEQRKDKTSVGALERLFEERGFQYAASDSQTTTTMYGKERTFTQDGKKYLFKRHLTLGGGDRQNCLQIYFEFDHEQNRVDIGYCGVHLPYDGMRS